MSRCLCGALGGVMFLFLGANSPAFAAELSLWSTGSDSIALPETSSPDSTFDKYRIELGGVTVDSPIDFEAEVTLPLVADGGNAARLTAGNEIAAESSGSEWDYLWRNASRIPITSIPEPSTASLLISGGLLLWLRRARKPRQ